MVHKKFQEDQLSALGLGMMRLPVLDGDDGKVDEAAAAEMIDCAYQNGINYFDTAWGYHRKTAAGRLQKRTGHLKKAALPLPGQCCFSFIRQNSGLTR